MNYLKLMLALVAGSALAAGIDVEQFTADAKAALVREFKDPDSAQFRSVFVIRWNDNGREVYSLCGEANGKNSYGAYVGFKPFSVDQMPNGKLVPSSELAGVIAYHCLGKLHPVERIN